MNYLTNLNLNKNQLQNAVIHPLTTAPSNPVAGQIYYNSTDKIVYYYDGTEWVDFGSSYELPVATTSELGGVIVGDGLSVDANGQISVDDIAFADLTDHPTTLAGYGITDANISNGTITLGSDTITPVVDANYVHTDNNFTTALKNKLDGIEEGAEANVIETVKVNGTAVSVDSEKAVDISVPVQSVAGKTGAVTLDKSDVGLGNVDNTSDATKKTNFTGTIASGDTGFVTGGDAYTALNGKLSLSGGTMSGDIAMGSNKVTGVGAPTSDGDAANKKYVDDSISGLGTLLNFKGTVGTTAALPTTGMSKGDVYIVTADNSEWVWTSDSATGTASDYEELGPTIDLSGYLQIANLATSTGSGTTTAMTQKAVTDALAEKQDTITAGTGLSMAADGVTINHSNSVTAGTAGTNSATSGATLAVPYVTYDAQGHITASGTHTHTIDSIDLTSAVTGILPVANGGTGNSTVDTAPTSGSTKMVTSGGVYTALNGLIKTATGTIGTSATSATVAYTGTLIATRTEMNGAEVVTEVAVGASSVTFTTASAPASAVTCTVIYA